MKMIVQLELQGAFAQFNKRNKVHQVEITN